jgi:23S rRNA G2445 N2-methylase RlmL
MADIVDEAVCVWGERVVCEGSMANAAELCLQCDVAELFVVPILESQNRSESGIYKKRQLLKADAIFTPTHPSI